MNYEEARPQIKSGDLLAWTHRSWKSIYDIQVQAVRTFTQSEFCHVGVAWVLAGRVFVVEAVQPLARVWPLSKLGAFYWIPTDVDWTPEVEERAVGFIGTPYSKMRCIKAYFDDEPDADESTAQCAMVARRILLSAGIPMGSKETPSAVVDDLLDLGFELHKVSP